MVKCYVNRRGKDSLQFEEARELVHGVGQPPVGTFLSFEEARELVWNEGLTTRQQWREWCDACSPLYSNLIGFSSLTRVDQV